jgi:hypothetical protein
MTLSAITFCPSDSHCNIHDIIHSCGYGMSVGNKCKKNNLTLFSKSGFQINCAQYNYGTNKPELNKVVGEDKRYGYIFELFSMSNCFVKFALHWVVLNEVNENVHQDKLGGLIEIVLTKTQKTTLGAPFSQRNDSKDYSQVNCVDDCLNKVMNEVCRCAFPAECANFDECWHAYINTSVAIKSKCNKQCPFECNKVSFWFSSRDSELELDETRIGHHNPIMSEKLDRTGRQRVVYFYFDKFETTQITLSASMSPTSLFGNVGGLLSIILHSLVLLTERLT